MDKISLPTQVTFESGKEKNESIVSIQPCHPGFGTTLGNALRRVLLSSLPGAAITAFKLKNAPHEFTAVPGIQEDVVELSLNLKQVRMHVFSDEPVELELKAKGEVVVTAADITANSNVKIVNPDQVICTLTSKSAEVDMKIIVEKGRGYVPTEMREGKQLEVGMIAIDAIFTPIRNVGFHIDNVRVGQMTNYENLMLAIETDGTMTPQEALNQASNVLIDHYQFIVGAAGSATPVAEESTESVDTEEAGEVDEKPKKARKKKSSEE